MKLKQKTMKQIKGSVSILLVLIMLPMMTFAAVIVDMSRINMAKQMVSSAGSLTLNSELANYDTILKDVYGLFAMSQVQNESPEETAARVKDYFERTLVSYDIVEEEEAGKYVENLMGDFDRLWTNTGDAELKDFLQMEITSANAAGIPNSSLATPDILRKQIVEYMKYRAPIEFGMSFLDALKSFSTVGDQTKVVEAQVKAQESTQDVTQACKKLIDLFREYDKLVEERNALDEEKRAVYATSSKDLKYVELEDYDSQMTMLRDGLGMQLYHFKNLNRINMVFLDNNPNVDNVYLKNLDFANAVYYIKAGGAGLVHENSGISFTVDDLATELADAETQMTDHINTLNSTYLTFANNYINQNFISAEHLALDEDTLLFANETAAVNSFTNFEKFLLNQLDVKYDDPNGAVDVKGTLDEIYRLEKYFANYKDLKQPEITAAETEHANALGVLYQEQQTRSSVKSKLTGAINNINTTVSALYPDLTDEDILTFLPEQTRNEILGIFEKLPSVQNNAFRSYYSAELTIGASNQYDHYFDWLTESSSLKENNEVVKAAKGYSGTAADFEKHMKDKVGSGVVNKDEYKLLKCLLQCSEYAKTFADNIGKYEEANTRVTNAQNEVDAKWAVYQQKLAERQAVEDKMKACLVNFIPFVTTYQEDAYTFGQYIETAKEVVDMHIAGIQVSYIGMLTNMTDLTAKQQEIIDQIDVVNEAIGTYNDYLDAWEEKNNSYVAQYGSDSFSKQAAADIKTARSEYDEQLFTDLKSFVETVKGRFDDFKDYMTDPLKNVYGLYHMRMIGNPQIAIEAVQGFRSSESIVTIQMADDDFYSVFEATPYGGEFDPYTISSTKQLCFLKPTVVQYQALKYLDSAYPEEENKVDIGLRDDEGNAVDPKDGYDNLTDSMSQSSGGSSENTSSIFTDSSPVPPDSGGSDNKFGYTYMNDGKSIPETGLPSAGSTATTVEDGQYKLSKDGDDVDVSSGMSSQTGAMEGVLKNIGSALNAGLENLYILSYIFENFSYNTMVQDAMIEADKKNPDGPKVHENSEIADAIALMSDEAALKAVVDQVPMLSGGYLKNGKNNYLYGAEVEYILYGGNAPSKNVTNAKASIYAIRFGFNCIYAFTDSSIRNSTMAVGLAVQAATCGIVPYQVVQVVLQLALVAAESALDLELMKCGLKVAVVKSRDTWLLGKSGVEVLAGVVANAAETAINDLTTGVQDLVDAGSEEILDAVNNLKNSIDSATNKAMEDVLNQSIGHITKAIETKLNELLHITESAQNEVEQKVEEVFAGLDTQLKAELDAMFAGNDLAKEVLALVEPEISRIISSVKTKITTTLTAMPEAAAGEIQDAGAYLISQLNAIKADMIQTVTQVVGRLTGRVSDLATEFVTEFNNSVNECIDEYGKELSEQAAENIRDVVSEAANGFINEHLGGGAGIGSGAGDVGANSSLASVIKFGYKDYLMLFTYIAICAGDDAILQRTADVIQLNLQHAGEGAQFTHKKGAEFKMSQAYTYVMVDAKAELDLLLMDFSIFANIVAEDDDIGTEETGTAEDTEESTGFPIEYKGILGY